MKLNSYQKQPACAMGSNVARRLLAYQAGNNGYTLNLMQATAGGGAPLHSHPHLQVVYVISGGGEFQVGEETAQLKTGDVVQIDANQPHTFNSFTSDTVWLEFFTPEREDFAPKE